MASQKPGPVCEVNDSWVELAAQQGTNAGESEPTVEFGTPHASIHSDHLEKLLIEAQRESGATSYANSKESSARGSPGSPHSPNTEWATGDWRTKQDPGTDWMWNWSSGPELQPTSDWNEKFRHPAGKPRRPAVSSSKVPAKRPGFFGGLPTLLFTHACTFFLGAAVMFICLRKYYWRWPMAVQSALD